jgi:hypothetical protein
MKLMLTLAFIITLSSCNSAHKKDSNLNPYPIYVDFINQDTIRLPDAIRTDMIKNKDPKYETNVEIFIPYFPSDSTLNNHIHLYFEEQQKEFTSSVQEMVTADSSMLEGLGSFYSANPTAVYIDSDLISVCFITDRYFSGAPHGLAKYESFNYDRKKKIILKFPDYFFFSQKGDSIKMLAEINKGINKEWIKLNQIYNIDFNIEIDTIAFNFDNYEIASYAEGLIKGKVPIKSINNLINKIYR